MFRATEDVKINYPLMKINVIDRILHTLPHALQLVFSTYQKKKQQQKGSLSYNWVELHFPLSRSNSIEQISIQTFSAVLSINQARVE